MPSLPFVNAFFVETFFLGLKNLRLHKLRSLLTALGIIFGVAAVIIMVAIGEGSKRSAMDQIRQLGATNLLVRSIRPPQSDEATSKTTRVLDFGIKRIDYQRLCTLKGLRRIVPLKDTEQKVIRGDIRVSASAIGTTPELFEVINLKLSRGRFFTQLDVDKLEQVCVIGATAARQLFPYQDPLGETIQVGTAGQSTVILRIVGVLESTGLRAGADSAGITNRDIDSDVYFPLPLARQAFGDTIVRRESGSMERKQIELSEIWLQVEDPQWDDRGNQLTLFQTVESTASRAENLLRVTRPKLADIDIKVPLQILRKAEELSRLFNFIMVGIASFSLVVGGIGIMNIMLATVTERTKEIGIRRALGAKRHHITMQFLVETTVISLSGGLIGIGLGSGFAWLLPIVVRAVSNTNYPTAINTASVVGSFVVSGLIGIGFGLYPAMQAARMNPIEALRHE